MKLLDTPPETRYLAISKSGTAAIANWRRKGRSIGSHRPGGTEPRMLGELNPFLDSIAETRWSDFDYANAEGSARAAAIGMLAASPRLQSGRRYPLIVEVYPDRPGGCAAPEQRARFAMGADSTHPIQRASPGRPRFHCISAGYRRRNQPHGRRPSGCSVRRRRSRCRCRPRGRLRDPGRIGLMGFSQGGFASLWIATQSRRYKAVVSLNGWSDLASNFFANELGAAIRADGNAKSRRRLRYLTPAGTEFSMGGTPWKFPQRYIQNSPLWRSDGVSAPVLLIHSDMDEFDRRQLHGILYVSLHPEEGCAAAHLPR